ncbi:MAG: hypothetical protein IKF97_07190 [Clostridia bacterium]|nr:hypothetical protein [Clostridia bacterium]
MGGILTIIQELKVDKVIISKQAENSENYTKFKELVNEKHIKVLIISMGETLRIEQDLYFEVLWPDNEKLITENALNNNSIVCKLYYKNFSMIFTGDIEENAEKLILQKFNNSNILNSTVLKVGHHGSKTSSTLAFLEAVKPKMALIGVGENNKFGHPNDEVIKRLQTFGTRIYRTDKMGEITLIIDNKGKIKVEENIQN